MSRWCFFIQFLYLPCFPLLWQWLLLSFCRWFMFVIHLIHCVILWWVRFRMPFVIHGCKLFLFHAGTSWTIKSGIFALFLVRVSTFYSILFKRVNIAPTMALKTFQGLGFAGSQNPSEFRGCLHFIFRLIYIRSLSPSMGRYSYWPCLCSIWSGIRSSWW